MTANILDRAFTMTTSSSDIIRELESRYGNPVYNTSYPLNCCDWKSYQRPGSLPFNLSESIAFYIHIPFCRQLCSFCEYTRMCLPSLSDQLKYIKTLRKDSFQFIKDYPRFKLYGFDIGGGTPTALESTAFQSLMDVYWDVSSLMEKTSDFEPSIEGTFETLTEEKCQIIADAGIKRISLGLQSTNPKVLAPLNRHNARISKIASVMEHTHKAGIQKINLDLMYGLPRQNLESLKNDILTVKELNPEQVTLYELRTNQLSTDYQIDSELCYHQYCRLFNELIELGYIGEFGQNTFSRNAEDKGLSSYLRRRMFEGKQYKGFGISAQSMSEFGLSYNKGKNLDDLTRILDETTCESHNYYALPPKEVFSKFIAISGYSGGFSLDTCRRLYGNDFERDFHDVIETLENNQLISINGDRLQLTKKGFKNYGSILSMFYLKKEF